MRGERAYGLAEPQGRRRKPDPPVVVTVVVRTGESRVLEPDSALGRAIGQLAAVLARW